MSRPVYVGHAARPPFSVFKSPVRHLSAQSSIIETKTVTIRSPFVWKPYTSICLILNFDLILLLKIIYFLKDIFVIIQRLFYWMNLISIHIRF